MKEKSDERERERAKAGFFSSSRLVLFLLLPSPSFCLLEIKKTNLFWWKGPPRNRARNGEEKSREGVASSLQEQPPKHFSKTNPKNKHFFWSGKTPSLSLPFCVVVFISPFPRARSLKRVRAVAFLFFYLSYLVREQASLKAEKALLTCSSPLFFYSSRIKKKN